MGRTHYVVGICAGLGYGIAISTNPIAALTCSVISSFFARIPDWDHFNSSDIRRLGILGRGIAHVLRFISKLLTGRKHRGLTHTLIFAFCISLIFAFIMPPIFGLTFWHLFGAAFIGFLSALWGDYITEVSLDNLFWPLKIPSLMPRALRIKTGNDSYVEQFIYHVTVGIIVLQLLWIVFSFVMILI